MIGEDKRLCGIRGFPALNGAAPPKKKRVLTARGRAFRRRVGVAERNAAVGGVQAEETSFSLCPRYLNVSGGEFS